MSALRRALFLLGLPLILCAARAQEARPAAKLQHLEAPGIENFYRVGEKVYSGSSPEGEAAFADLQRRGIKTLISVDGAKPEVELARKYGLRYVHLPIGYDGVPTNQAVKLAKAAASLPQPIFIHCHHGKHRGPAAAAVVCMTVENWTAAQGLEWLKAAGTATNYAGLYRSVAQFERPAAAALAKLPADFPEKTTVSPLVDAMVEIDVRFDNLKLVKEAGYKKPPAHPDVDPAHEALLLQELFREFARTPEFKKHDADFQKQTADAEKVAADFHVLMQGGRFTKEAADAAFLKVNDSCARCHKAHRN